MDNFYQFVDSIVKCIENHWEIICIGGLPALLLITDIHFKRSCGFSWDAPGGDVAGLGAGIYFSAILGGYSFISHSHNYPAAIFIGLLIIGIWYLVVRLAQLPNIATIQWKMCILWSTHVLAGMLLCWLAVLMVFYYYNFHN